MKIGEYVGVTFIGGNNIEGDFYPVYNYTSGESTTFTVKNTYSSSNSSMTMDLYLDIDEISSDLEIEAFKYVLVDGNSTQIATGDFSTYEEGDTIDIILNYVLPSNTSNYTFYIYLDGNDENSSSVVDKSFSATLRIEANVLNAARYITNLYTSATKSTATVNGESITRTAGSKKLWRIIGVFDGRLKLIQNDPISTTNLSWDTSANETGGNSGYGINEWSQADIMKLLNTGYENDTVNNSLYWNKSSGTVYTGSNNATTSNVSFANTGLSASEKNLIDTATWYLGAHDAASNTTWEYKNTILEW